MLRTSRSAVGGQLSLKEWVKRSLLPTGAKVLLRCKGNILHILCEGETCPNEAIALHCLTVALKETHPNMVLPANHSPIYQVFLYGRAIGQKRPNWTEQLDPNDFLSMPARGEEAALAGRRQGGNNLPPTGALTEASSKSAGQSVDLLEKASRGNAFALARHLSNVLSPYGVGVKVFIKDISFGGERPQGKAPVAKDGKRLWVLCQSSYSPDPALLAEPVARQLRKVEPMGFRDAVIVGQVAGEKKPEWICGVDLTPRERILEEWSRWGDVGALAKLLNRRLAGLQIETTAVLKESTVHLFFSHKGLLGGEWNLQREGQGEENFQPSGDNSSPKDALKAIVRPILEAVAPQGIFGATLYGQLAEEAPPSWVDWLDLPASYQASLAPSAMELSRLGNERALKFLLERELNPDLDRKLLTGGYNVAIRSHADLLHVMVDGALSVAQEHIGPKLAEFVASLTIPGVAGVRVYGRSTAIARSSTKWRYSLDFQPRQPAPEPQEQHYGASAARELAREDEMPSTLVLSPDLNSDELQACLTKQRTKISSFTALSAEPGSPNVLQQLLIWSGLFLLEPGANPRQQAMRPRQYATSFPTGRTLTVWGLLGLLLTVGADWFVGSEIRQAPFIRTVSEVQGVAIRIDGELREPIGDRDGSEETTQNSRGFSAPVAGESQTARSESIKANSGKSYPSFNSEQLDRQIAEYSQYIATVGKPDVLILGSSRALRGIDPLVLQSSLKSDRFSRELRIFNFGVNGATARVVDWIVRELIDPNYLPELIVWADGARAFNSGRTDRTMGSIRDSVGYRRVAGGDRIGRSAPEQEDLGAGETAGPRWGGFDVAERLGQLDDWLNRQLAAASRSYGDRDRAIGFLTNTIRPGRNKPTPTPAAEAIASNSTIAPEARGRRTPEPVAQLNGFLPVSTQFAPRTYYEQYARVPGNFDADYASFSLVGEQTRALNNLLQFVGKREISLVFVNMPLTDNYLDPFRTASELKFQEYMRRKASENQFVFKDFSDLWPKQYSFFSDPSHLNALGAKEVSVLLASDRAVPWPSADRKSQE